MELTALQCSLRLLSWNKGDLFPREGEGYRKYRTVEGRGRKGKQSK